MQQWDELWIDVNLATMDRSEYGTVRDAALATVDGRIAWLGPAASLPGRPEQLARTIRSGGGGWMTPGLIDCHTHLVFGGERWREFELRLQRASYEAISRAGGGIVATV